MYRNYIIKTAKHTYLVLGVTSTEEAIRVFNKSFTEGASPEQTQMVGIPVHIPYGEVYMLDPQS